MATASPGPTGPGLDPGWKVYPVSPTKGGHPAFQIRSQIRSDDEEIEAVLSALIDGLGGTVDSRPFDPGGDWIWVMTIGSVRILLCQDSMSGIAFSVVGPRDEGTAARFAERLQEVLRHLPAGARRPAIEARGQS